MKLHKTGKTVTILILLLSTMMIISGCSKPVTAREALTNTIRSTDSLESLALNFNGGLSVEFESSELEESEAAKFLDIFKNIQFSGNYEMMKSGLFYDLAAHYNLDMNGLSIKLETYMDEDKAIVKYPMMPQYIVMDFDSIAENMAAESGEEVDFDKIMESAGKLSDEMSLDMTLAVLAAINDEEMSYEKNHVFTSDDTEIKSDAVTIRFTRDTFVRVFNAFYDYMIDSEAFYNYVKEYSYEDMGTFEDYKQSLRDAKKEMIAELKDSEVSFDDIFKKLDFSIVIGFDKKYKLTQFQVSTDVSIYDESTETTVGVLFNLMSMISNHNGITSVEIPEITEDNSLDIMDMMYY